MGKGCIEGKLMCQCIPPLTVTVEISLNSQYLTSTKPRTKNAPCQQHAGQNLSRREGRMDSSKRDHSWVAACFRELQEGDGESNRFAKAGGFMLATCSFDLQLTSKLYRWIGHAKNF